MNCKYHKHITSASLLVLQLGENSLLGLEVLCCFSEVFALEFDNFLSQFEFSSLQLCDFPVLLRDLVLPLFVFDVFVL